MPAPADWPAVKALALGLGLPGVAEATSWGQPCLKAHGKLWVWWSPHEDAPVFKLDRDTREMLVAADPDTFFVTPHYRSHPLVLMRPDRFDPVWAEANLRHVWREQAPKRWLRVWEAAQASPDDPRLAGR